MKFILIAEEKKAPVNFFPAWKVILLVLVIVFILVILFPSYLLQKTITYYHQPSSTMLSYLKAFRSIYPQNNLLLEAIIEQEIGLGEIKKAQADLKLLKSLQITPSIATINQFRWLMYLSLRQQTYKSKMNTPLRIKNLRKLRQLAKELADVSLSPQQLIILAQDNLSLARASVALKIYNDLLKTNNLKKLVDLNTGGNVAMQNNAPDISAKFYWLAFKKSKTLANKKQYALKTLKALWAGNQLQQALDIANQLPENVINNRNMLTYLSKLAIAANQPKTAQKYAIKALRMLKKDEYDDNLYLLAYQTLIYNSKISMAYSLARLAVSHQPKSLAWHEKLAETATFVGDYNKAMLEWLYVARHTNNKNLLLKSISITKLLGYDLTLKQILHIYLKQEPKDAKMWLLLASTENKTNEPKLALQTLKKLNKLHPSKKADVLTATIYQDQDQWQNALKTWQKINKSSPDIDSILAEANIYYTNREFKKALDILKQGIPLAKPDNLIFWNTLGDLAWDINDRHLAVLGYSHNLADYSHLINLIQLQILANPKDALFYSLRGWITLHKSVFFFNALSTAEQLQRLDTIAELLSNLTQKTTMILEKHPEFWQAQANLYRAFGEKEAEKKVLMQAVMLHPEFLPLKNDLLWFLMTNGESKWVTYLMNEWGQDMHDPILWHAFAEGYDIDNQFNAAIAIYQSHLLKTFAEDQVLIDYAALLEKILLYKEAANVRQFVWQRALKRLNQTKTLNQETLATLSQLAPLYVSGTLQIQYLAALLNLHNNNKTETINIALNWMMERNDIDLISFFKAYYLHNGLPYKADIISALIKNDLSALQNFIEKPEQPFLRSERINAAARLENTPLAEELAIHELTDRPKASEIYTEFEQYAISDANFIRVSEEYQQFINLVGERTLLESKLKLTNKWKLRPYFSRWDVKTNDSAILTNVPVQDLRAGFKLEEKIHRGLVTYNLGYRDALNSFTPIDFNLNYKLDSRFTANFNLGVNQEVVQTAYLYIGGVQDQINLTLFYNAEKYDFLQFEVEGLNYYSQNRHYLADGYNLHGLYEHKLWLSYPDLTFGVFADEYYFNRNGSYGGDITTLFPQLTPAQQANPETTSSIESANYQQIIPPSYAQGGFIFSFGNAILDYSHAWRPYFWGSIFYNTYVGLANDVKVGLNGSVLGRDSLLFYAERGTAQAAANSLTYTVGAKYSLYL